MGEVKRYIADVATCVDVIPTESVSGAKFVLASDYATLEAELVRTAAQRDAILQQARAWAGEAKTQRSTVLEVGEILGGIPDWGPISAGVEAMAAENPKLRAELERRAVPDGWRLVPDDLCVGMREAGKRVIQEAVAVMKNVTLDDLYTAMIAAAPSAPKADDPVKVQLLEALEELLDAYSKPDDRICCAGIHCGCMGATKHQLAEHDARAAIAAARK